MEYITCCDICFTEFNENVFIPKILSCGHTFCSSCIKKLIESNPKCPKCRNELNKDIEAAEYPTNYSLIDSLKMVGELESSLGSSKHLIKDKVATNKEFLTSKIWQISTMLEEAKKDLEQLQDLIDSDNDIIDVKKTKQVLDSLEVKYKTEHILSDFEKLRGSVTYNLSDFGNSDEYLTQIYNKIRNEEKIYAVKNVDQFIKYGKVSLQENMILCHSLSETEKPDSTSIIWFDDLKECVAEKNFFTFLNLSCNEKGVIHTVIIKMLNLRLASKFITLCTGECGSTYRGLLYTKNIKEYNPCFCGILKLEESCKRSLIQNKRIDYNTKASNDFLFDEDDVIVAVGEGRSLNICRILDTVIIADAVGKVESSHNLENIISLNNSSNLNIVDCGILYKI